MSGKPQPPTYSSGQVYSFLMLTGKSFLGKQSARYVEAICECGKIWFASYTDVKKGRTKSCGCKKHELVANGARTHGLSKTLIYQVWRNIGQRCNNENTEGFEYYGGKGIKVCPEWENDFMSFYNWGMNNGYKKGLSLDRINGNGNYDPTNCRWATDSVQNRNTTRNLNITAFGETKCLTDWVSDDRCSISFGALKYRLQKMGMDAESAITKPAMKKNGEFKRDSAGCV